MAVNHDFQCTNPECDTQYFESLFTLDVADPLTGDYAGPPCPQCNGATIRVILPPRTSWRCDAVVVYRAPDGSFRFPGAVDGASTAKYDRAGYERIEARSAAEVRALETRVNAYDRDQAQQSADRHQPVREHRESLRRGELRGRMSAMSQLGRAVARAAQQRNDHKRRHQPGGGGFFVDVFSNDRGSRDESRRSDGKHFKD